MKALLLATLFISAEAFGWGTTGHRTVGAVAEKYLDPAVAQKIHRLMGGMSLAKASTWPDEIKSDPANYSHTYNWHYTEWKDEDHTHDETHSTGRLLGAIREQVELLKDSKTSQDKKVFAIKFIVHLIGDLHMPLHVGNGLDQGGNKCKVLFHKKETNLHALWDEGMIDFSNLSFTELAHFVSQGKKRADVNKTMNGDLVEWAMESKILRSSIYPQDMTPSQAPMSVRAYCRSDIVVTQELMPILGYEYSYKFLPIVEQKLFQAGVRLAKVLNIALK